MLSSSLPSKSCTIKILAFYTFLKLYLINESVLRSNLTPQNVFYTVRHEIRPAIMQLLGSKTLNFRPR